MLSITVENGGQRWTVHLAWFPNNNTNQFFCIHARNEWQHLHRWVSGHVVLSETVVGEVFNKPGQRRGRTVWALADERANVFFLQTYRFKSTESEPKSQLQLSLNVYKNGHKSLIIYNFADSRTKVVVVLTLTVSCPPNTRNSLSMMAAAKSARFTSRSIDSSHRHVSQICTSTSITYVHNKGPF